jgi:hypothetical protein
MQGGGTWSAIVMTGGYEDEVVTVVVEEVRGARCEVRGARMCEVRWKN